MRKSLVAALATLVVAAVALSACTGTVAKGSTVRVAVSQPFSSYNAKTSFGTYQVISREPFRVRYTVRDGRKWSDGAAVDGADILLSWAANSDALNTPGFDSANYPDPDSGRYTKPFPAGVLHFDGFSGNGLQLVTKTPVIDHDGRSLTLTYDHPFVDWELVFGVGLPAHVVAERALGIEGPTRAKEALVTAIQKDDTAKLASEDVAKALLSIDNATVPSGSDGPYDHLDLQFAHSRSGTFDNPIVRKAFLKTVPRQLSHRGYRGGEGAARPGGRGEPAGVHPVRSVESPPGGRIPGDLGLGGTGGLQRDRLLEH